MHADFITNTLMDQIWFMIVDLFGCPSGTFCGDKLIQIIWNLIYYLDDKITGYWLVEKRTIISLIVQQYN